MNGVNKVMLVGNLGGDPFKTSTLTGKTLTTFNMATNEFVKELEGDKIVRTEWHKVVTWGKTAEACAKMLRKGSKVYVEGHIRSTPKKVEENGPTTYYYEISASDVIFLSNYGNNASGNKEQADEREEDELFENAG
jgi:single-strand DNA-binding protein